MFHICCLPVGYTQKDEKKIGLTRPATRIKTGHPVYFPRHRLNNRLSAILRRLARDLYPGFYLLVNGIHPQKAKIPRIPQEILPQNIGKIPGSPGIPAKKHHRWEGKIPGLGEFWLLVGLEEAIGPCPRYLSPRPRAAAPLRGYRPGSSSSRSLPSP